jgi:hypothetical protein
MSEITADASVSLEGKGMDGDAPVAIVSSRIHAIFGTEQILMSSSQIDFPLPLDIVDLIARILVHDRAVGSLVQFNRTCRVVHADTLPILYERLSLRKEEDLMRIVGPSNPKGFAFVKYVTTSSPHRMTNTNRCVVLQIP